MLLVDMRALAVEHEVGRERDERQVAVPARLGHPAGESSVHELGFLGSSSAEVRAAQDGRVHDGLRLCLLHEAPDRARVHQGRSGSLVIHPAGWTADRRP
jgi:hypothetical protein